ncbi:MAG: TldD protein [Bradymonadia bacterium]|jgi:TldD protein
MLTEVSDTEKSGLCVRVLVEGAWGFAAVGETSNAAAREAVRRAIEQATLAKIVAQHPSELSAPATGSGEWRTPLEIDPFGLPLSHVTESVRSASDRAGADDRIVAQTANAQAVRREQLFQSTEDVRQFQQRDVVGGGGEVTAVGNGDVQRRSVPSCFDGNFGTGGWERFEAMALGEKLSRAREEALILLAAERCPSGQMDVVLGSAQLALQIHESIGHPAEADRYYGWEDAYAGGAYLSPADIGTRRIGSEHVTLHADATEPGGLGTVGWDDEGVAARRWPLVERGVVVGALGSRELDTRLPNAARTPSAGAMRSAGFNRQPLVRMVNVSLEPGSVTLQSLIGGVERGVFMDVNRSWSIDDRRLQFQFGCEIGREIVNGELGQWVKNPTYAGVTPQFWSSCDGIADRESYALWGFLNCGKGQPGQSMMTSHGAAPARFRGVDVGVGYVD